jgi:hypothetical protein
MKRLIWAKINEINKFDRLNILGLFFLKAHLQKPTSQKSTKSKFTAKLQQYNGNTVKMTDRLCHNREKYGDLQVKTIKQNNRPNKLKQQGKIC